MKILMLQWLWPQALLLIMLLLTGFEARSSCRMPEFTTAVDLHTTEDRAMISDYEETEYEARDTPSQILDQKI